MKIYKHICMLNAIIYSFIFLILLWLTYFIIFSVVNISEISGWSYMAYTPASAQMVSFLFYAILSLALNTIAIKIIGNTALMWFYDAFKEWSLDYAKRTDKIPRIEWSL